MIRVPRHGRSGWSGGIQSAGSGGSEERADQLQSGNRRTPHGSAVIEYFDMMATRQRDRGYGDSSPSSYELQEPGFLTGLRLEHSHERLVDWRRIAAEARSILLITAHLRRGIPTQVNHWADVRGLFLHNSQVATRSPDIQKWVLSLALVG